MRLSEADESYPFLEGVVGLIGAMSDRVKVLHEAV